MEGADAINEENGTLAEREEEWSDCWCNFVNTSHYRIPGHSSMTINEAHFKVLVNAIKRNGYDEDTAVKYATIIGDTPVIDEEGKTVVTDSSGNELARFKIDYFDYSPYSRDGKFSIVKFLLPGNVDNIQRVFDEKQFQNLSPFFKVLLVIAFLMIIVFLVAGIVMK